LDDGFASVFEILTVSGKYCWVPGEQVAALELRPPQGPRDLLWRQARITLGTDGLEGNVYLPAIYPLTETADAAARLGRSTTWHGGEGTPVRGVGQRMFLVGEQAMPIMDIETLSFT
jgi:type VI secretion system protein ImpE